MNWLDWWAHTGTTLVVSAVGTVATLWLSAATRISDGLFGHVLDRRIEGLKHRYEAEIETLRIQLSHIGDRGVRSNEREYNSVIAAWEATIDAYGLTQASIFRFTEHPDLAALTDLQVREYLKNTVLSEIQQKQVLEAPDRNKMYGKVLRHRAINEAGAAIFAARQVVLKQGISMPPEVEKEFNEFLELVRHAHVSESIDFSYGPDKENRKDVQKLSKDGPAMLEHLKATVRARILMADQIAISNAISQ